MKKTQTPLENLYALGQSVWYDNIHRGLLENGEISRMIAAGEIQGITSNPTIFEKAISQSNNYESALRTMAWAGLTAEEIFYQLAMEDIQTAADLFLPLYNSTEGHDGYVSLEVSPFLAHNTQKTIEEARNLWEKVNRPNVMIKIPATIEGIEAIYQAIADGININVTLIFSIDRYEKVIDAFMRGIEDRVSAGLPVDNIASVASFFISRVDQKIDGKLNEFLRENGPSAGNSRRLMGKIAIANSTIAYSKYLEYFNSSRWKELENRGAKKQRTLWASTGTKNPAYGDVYYIENLVFMNTVNTIPPETLLAYKDHGHPAPSPYNLDESRQLLSDLSNLGINLQNVTTDLEIEGVKSFSDSFEKLLASIDKKKIQAEKELGVLLSGSRSRLQKMIELDAVKRLYNHDPALWTQDPSGQSEVIKRLGWINAPGESLPLIESIENLLADCLSKEYEYLLLLGMGGSSLAPEVFSEVFQGENRKGLKLKVLDSTDPDEINAAQNWSPVKKTLYIVSSKSGTTIESSKLLDYFWDYAYQDLGRNPSDHFVAITDPGTPLESLGNKRGFRQVFQGNPYVGGRYSVLTAFGLVPAGLLGINLSDILRMADKKEKLSRPDIHPHRNTALVLGSILGEAALQGKDKLTILADQEYEAIGAWLEQLVAESSGKEGKGILPVDLEPAVDPSLYQKDRIFVYLRKDNQHADTISSLLESGHPVIQLDIPDKYGIGAHFYLWEMAVSYACSILGVNAFDQPNVQDSKTQTMKLIDQYNNSGELSFGNPVWDHDEATLYANNSIQVHPGTSLGEIIKHVLDSMEGISYIAINAFLPRTAENLNKLQSLRSAVMKYSRCATTLGFGPRFLHSTGQLHKGGPNTGLFIMITHPNKIDIKLPGEDYSFGILNKAQALGDFEALSAADRNAINIYWKTANIQDIINRLKPVG